MNKSKPKFRIKTRVYVPLIFILATLLITYVFPRQGKFKYSFNEGRPWRYGLLTAPFDFPIFKSQQQLQQDQDSILVFYEPYYKIDKAAETEAIAEFDADSNLDPSLSKLERRYIGYIRNSLLEIYKKGIINSAEYDKIAATKKKTLRLREDKEAKTRDLESFYTIKSAYEEIVTNAPSSLEVNVLKAAGINNYLQENIVYDVVTSDKAKNEFIQQVSPTLGMVQAGERIIGEGEIVDHNVYNILSSLKKVSQDRTGASGRSNWIILGEFMLVSILMGSFFMYLRFFRINEYRNRKHVTFMVLLITFFVILTAINVSYNFFNVYIIPFAIVTILIRTFIDSRTALFGSLITVLICTLMVSFAFEFMILQMTIIMICIFNLKELTERSQLIRSSFIILGSYIIVYIGLVLAQEGDITKISWETLIYFLINFIFITFSYLLVYMVEKSFGFISGVSMVELANINKPILRKLSEEAPGTFQHSMQVSNLAAAAAVEIGANPSLVRTGALYHDIGKLENPAFFTENQSPGMNPHAGLPFEESARIIIDHVRLGVRMGHKEGLPQQIIDFIATHHGTSTPKYFYNSWKNANPGKEIDSAAFSYPGPNPFSKETAILMMADTVEAASRSLQEYTEESIRKLVTKLIDSQMQEGLFQKAPITFREVDMIKELFIEKLQTIYHSRIVYPELKEEAKKLKTDKTLNEI
ncbi:MAG TPA: HDIG domain-containing protein [Dysgonamonadaceae bacterium]|nr:HDIG domain-containing protein [Dysgonamonadaceae bacterium]